MRPVILDPIVAVLIIGAGDLKFDGSARWNTALTSSAGAECSKPKVATATRGNAQLFSLAIADARRQWIRA